MWEEPGSQVQGGWPWSNSMKRDCLWAGPVGRDGRRMEVCAIGMAILELASDEQRWGVGLEREKGCIEDDLKA